MELKCPACDSADVRRVSLIVKESTSGISMTSGTLGVGMAGGHLGVGGAATQSTGKQQTLLAQELAPPKQATPKSAQYGCMALAGVLVFLGGAYMLVGSEAEGQTPMVLIVLLIGVALAFVGISALRDKDNQDKWKREAEESQARQRAWERSFLCMRCGKVFESDV